MRIDKLTVKNFRGFAEQSFEFNKQFNILIGDNATGKTSILDALSIAMGSFLLGIKDVAGRHIRGEDVRYKFEKSGGQTFLRWQTPVEVIAEGKFDSNSIKWSRELNSTKGRTTTVNTKTIKNIADKLQREVENNQEVLLPLLCYYGTGRLWSQKKDTNKDDRLSREALAYTSALEHESDNAALFKWFAKNQIIQNEDKTINIQLQAVKNAMSKMLDGCDDVLYLKKYEGFVVKFSDGQEVLFSSLSDGQRSMLGLAADIAYRMALLNPHLKERICETNGIVLIDEIDLHLHPKWQREIVGKLKAAFPNIQFFATTHSPQIIGEAKPEYLRMLSRDDNGEIQITTPKQSLGLDSAEILEEIMGGVPRRNKEVTNKLEEIDKLIDDEDFAQAKNEIELLKTKLNGSIPAIVKQEGLITMLED